MVLTKPCAFCGKIFEKLPPCSIHNWNTRKKYCSNKCKYATMVDKHPWNYKMKGVYHQSEETKKKQSESHKGISTWNKNLTKETDDRVRKMSEKIAATHIFGFKPGADHWNWKDGSSILSYSKEWTNKLKEQIRNRDNYHCQICFIHQNDFRTKKGKKHKLCVHHIDYNKKNHNYDNLISLCPDCHAKTIFNEEYWIDFFRFYYNRGIEYIIEIPNEVLGIG
jgi:hypothetical protein